MEAATGRVIALTTIAQDLRTVAALSESVAHQRSMLESQRKIHEEMVAHSTAIIADTESQLVKLEAELEEVAERLDLTLAQRYQIAPPPPEGEGAKKRGKKSKDVTLQEVVTAAQEAGAQVTVSMDPEPSEGDGAREKFECSWCGDVFYSSAALDTHIKTARECAEKEATGAATEEKAQTESGEAAAPEIADAPDGGSAEPVTAEQYQPLNEPLGGCELCHGYGVLDGELYGEPAMVPCTCEAGAKVKGSPCDDCNVENPDCAECFVPDEPIAAVLPTCCNSSCSGNDPTNKAECKRFSGQECTSFVALEDCKHHPLRRVYVDGALICGMCDKVLTPAPAKEPDPEPVKEPPQASRLKANCPHPKPFREETPDGIRCKVCGTIIDQPGLFAA